MAKVIRANNNNNREEHQHIAANPHMSILYVDSDERLASGNTGVSDTISRAFYRSNEMFRAEVHQIGVSKIHVKYNTPTINPRNNTITFATPASGLFHTVTLVDGYYSPTTLMAHIQTQLNTVAGASLATFTIALVPGSNNTYLITATNTFQFVDSSHLARAAPCSGLRITDNAVASMTVIAKGFYTSFVDITCPDLKEGMTRGNTFTADTGFSNTQHLIRQHVNSFADLYSDITIDKDIHVIHYNKIRQRRVSELTIEVFDEFGDLAYAPDNIPYISYSMEISLIS